MNLFKKIPALKRSLRTAAKVQWIRSFAWNTSGGWTARPAQPAV